MMRQLAGQHPDRQRQVPAQPGQLADRGIARVQPRPPGQPDQQLSRLHGRQRVQADRVGVLQRGQVRRLVTSTRLPAVPGSSGLTCSCPAASSSTSSIRIPAR